MEYTSREYRVEAYGGYIEGTACEWKIVVYFQASVYVSVFRKLARLF